MEKDKHITRVIFRKFKDGDIIALFPDLPGTNDYAGTCESYMHIGQHGTASVDIVRDTKPARPSSYLPLKEELARLGYNLKVCHHFTRHSLQRRRKEVLRQSSDLINAE